jgi:hypothetical protein
MSTSPVRLAAASLLLLSLSACDSATRPDPVVRDVATLTPLSADLISQVREEEWEGGAIVFNAGEGKPDAFCFFQGGAFTTNQATLVRSPSGNWVLSCRFEGLAPIAERVTSTGWLCSIIGDPTAQTRHSSWIRHPSGSAHLDCHFSDKPITDAAVSFADVSTPAQQAAFSLPLADVPGQSVSGESVSIGLGCTPIGMDLTGKIAVAQRGVCTFTLKVQNALNAGAVGVIVYNNVGEQVIVMGGLEPVNLPAVFVGRSAGLALLASPAEVTITYCNRSASCRGQL